MVASEKQTALDRPSWYQMSFDQVKEAFSTNESGLSSGEARQRLDKYGYNELKFKKRGPFTRFLLQFRSPLIFVLLAAAIVTAFLQMWTDAAVILLVVLANAVVGFIQEGRAEASMEALAKLMVPQCTVLRDGQQQDIPAREVVPGDIVLLKEGDRVPADLRLFSARNLAADEAALTGESVPSKKHVDLIETPHQVPADQRNMAFTGTFITRGFGQGMVVATAKQTEIGKIATLIRETRRLVAAPLVRKVASFTRLLVIVVLILAAINLIIGAVIAGYDLVYSFLASVSLAVAAIPEGLPAILTIALALGARAMASNNALVRRLTAVETIGAATVICSDKTGTLTKNEMTVKRIYCDGSGYSVSGVGYDPRGDITLDGRDILPAHGTTLFETLQAGFLCNNAAFTYDEDDGYRLSGDPTEGALLVAALKGSATEGLTRLDEIPFESEHRYMATLHRADSENVIYVKGSPEKVLDMCQSQLSDGAQHNVDRDLILNEVRTMAKGALRVLGFACKRVPVDKNLLAPEDLNGLTFLGLQGMMDPPREEAKEAVAKCKKAGIRVIMITGDHPQTAQAVAEQLGIENPTEVLTGEDLAHLCDEDLCDVIEKVSVYARVAPVHKFKVATQLQKRGHIVVMTGDGVNDAPALKAADLGIAMGIKGTDVAKEASDIVLVDDNFASIVKAVEEGRHVFENIRKVILYTLPTNGGQALLVLGALLLVPFVPIFALRLPLEPIQILWINLYDAIILALPLLWERREKGLLDRPPRDPKEPLANSLFFRKVGVVSVVMAGAAFAVFYYYGIPAISGAAVDNLLLTQAQTAAFMTVMMVHIFYLLAARSLTRSVFAMNPFSNKRVTMGIAATVILHLLIIYVLPLVGINPLRVASFPAEWWITIVLLGVAGLLVVELEDFVVERLKGRKRRSI